MKTFLLLSSVLSVCESFQVTPLLVKSPPKPSKVTLSVTPSATVPNPTAIKTPPPREATQSASFETSHALGMFPSDLNMTRIEGEGTLRTVKIPFGVDRVHYLLSTDGRPLQARVEMWLGPKRRTHAMDIYMENGKVSPFRALLKFKHTDSAGNQMLVIRNTGPAVLPLNAAFEILPPEKSNRLADITETLWETHKPEIVQGGAIHYYPIASNVDSVQIIINSKRVGRRSCKAKIEVLSGPNNRKQLYDLHLSGGSQPYHAVFNTPGKGVTLRFVSKNLFELPMEVLVLPYKIGDHIVKLPQQPAWTS